MGTADGGDSFRKLARDFQEGRGDESNLSTRATRLPSLTMGLLENLSREIETLCLNQPRTGWWLAVVMDAAARAQDGAPLLRGLAAWRLGWASNEYTQPQRAEEAIARARLIFMELNEAGWVAACDWQRNALPWTRPDFRQAAEELRSALTRLEQHRFREFAMRCRLTLAYTQILTGDPDAFQNIQHCAGTFAANHDELNLARCWISEASYWRRASEHDRAMEKLKDARKVFKERGAVLDAAKADYQEGLIWLVRGADYPRAVGNFEKANVVFSSLDLDLWRAVCLNGLGQCHLLSGKPGEARKCLQGARDILLQFEIAGMLADNLNDSGKLELWRGRADLAGDLFQQAEEQYVKIGLKLSAAIALANRSEACAHLGRFQDALQHGERALKSFETLNDPSRRSACEIYLATIWWFLGRADIALPFVDKALERFHEAGENLMLAKALNLRAGILFGEKRWDEAIAWLEKTLVISQKSGFEPQHAISQRLLGEAHGEIGRFDEANDYLENAILAFAAMGMLSEQAAAFLAMGNLRIRAGQAAGAHAAFEAARMLSQGAMPTIDWRVQAGIAELQEAEANSQAAIASYRGALGSYAVIRNNFWQPSLAGANIQVSQNVVDKAVALAVERQSDLDAVNFIESNKATTLGHQLTIRGTLEDTDDSTDLSDIKAEIAWLQERLEASFHPSSRLPTSNWQKLHGRLRQLSERYEFEMAQQERIATQNVPGNRAGWQFDLERFRSLASKNLDHGWIALDYYLRDSELFTATITSQEVEVSRSEVGPRVKMALEACVNAERSFTFPSDSDLSVLGELLIPPEIESRLSPQTSLLIVPHGALHQVPWPAIRLGAESRHLIHRCIPVLAPALHYLALLWERGRPAPERANGLIIGIADFGDSRALLPGVREEIADIVPQLGQDGKSLIDGEASWENLLKLAHHENPGAIKGLARFSFLHFASHIFYNPLSSKLGGMALADKDIWLDQVHQLTPLPQTVTFSACNGTHSIVYEGGELAGLPLTCLTGGARCVVGSRWRVTDDDASALMIAFYSNYLAGRDAAEALALAQRQAVEIGVQLESWAGFTCIGTP